MQGDRSVCTDAYSGRYTAQEARRIAARDNPMAMQRWLKKLFGRAETPASTPTEAKTYLPAKWLEPNDRGNPFGVPLLDLMELQRMISMSQDLHWLVAHGVPLEARTKRGHTALHTACALGSAEVAKALLAAGADAHASSPDGSWFLRRCSGSKADNGLWNVHRIGAGGDGRARRSPSRIPRRDRGAKSCSAIRNGC